MPLDDQVPIRGKEQKMTTKPNNAFTRYGIDPDEWTEALADAMRTGGASEQEIQEAVAIEHAEYEMDDPNPPWTLHRRS
jgi:hypothetical protein